MRARLQAFPSTDREFVTFARASWEALPETALPEDLQAALRRRYPAAIVTVQHELARREYDPVVWYAFRHGAIVAADAERQGGAPESWPAWAILDGERRILDVSP